MGAVESPIKSGQTDQQLNFAIASSEYGLTDQMKSRESTGYIGALRS